MNVDRSTSAGVVSYKATITITCSACMVAFLFSGLPTVSSLTAITSTPAASAGQKALFVPISPAASVACPHTSQFRPQVLIDRAVSGQTVTYKATLSMTCSNCSTAFLFNGLTLVSGIANITTSPASSTDKKQLFAPIAPIA